MADPYDTTLRRRKHRASEAEVRAEAERQQKAGTNPKGSSAQDPINKKAKLSQTLRAAKDKTIGAAKEVLEKRGGTKGLAKTVGKKVLRGGGWLGAAYAGYEGVNFALESRAAAKRDIEETRRASDARQQRFGILAPTTQQVEATTPSTARSVYDTVSDFGTEYDRLRAYSEAEEKIPYANAPLPTAIPGMAGEEGPGTPPNRSIYGNRPEGTRAHINKLNEARESVIAANIQGQELTDERRRIATQNRLRESGLEPRRDILANQAQEQRQARTQFLQGLNITPEESGRIEVAMEAFSNYIANPDIWNRLESGEMTPEEQDQFETEALAEFEGLDLSPEAAQGLFSRLRESGIEATLLNAIGDRIGVTSVLDLEGDLRTDDFITLRSEETESRKGDVIYAGMRDGVFVAQDTPGPGLTPQYTIADEAGNIPLGEDSFGNRLRSVELPDRAGSYFDKNYEAVGPGPVRPGLEPGDLRAKNRLFEAAPQRQFDKVNALNEANRIDAAVAQLERNADYDVTDEIPPRANLLASSRQDTAPSLRTRNITNPQHSRDFAAKLRNERDLGLLNKKAAQRAGRNIPGMSGAELAEIPTRKALSSLEYPERLDAIHELDRQAQANITRELNSPSFRKRVDELADPGGRLRAAAGGRASVAAELGRLRQDAAEEIRLDIIGKHKSVVPAGLRDATVDEYRAGLESTRKANVEKRRNYVEARIDAYTGGDAALNRKVGRSARMYGFFDAAGDNPLPASVIEENVSSIYAADKAIDVFQNITGKTVSTNKRRKAFAEGGYRQVVNLLYTMAGEGGDFYFRDPSIGGLKIFNKADRGAWFDQFISGISGGLFGDVSDDTIIFENRTTGKRITAGDLHGGDPVVKDMFQDFIDATYQRE